MGMLTAEHLRLGIATYDPEAYYNAVKGAPVHNISPQGERLEFDARGARPQVIRRFGGRPIKA